MYRMIEQTVRGAVKRNEPMSKHTSFRIGGPAELWVTPRSKKGLFAVLELCETRGIPYMIIGRGTNLLVRDGGIDGVVISLNDACRKLVINGEQVRVGAAVSLASLVKRCVPAGLGGLEFCTGIPGCVGGALAVNAGAFGQSIGNLLTQADVYDPKVRQVRTIQRDEVIFGYRKSTLAEFGVILEAEFTLKSSSPAEISARIEDYASRRKHTQPSGWKSAGCIFKNPAGHYAGELIERLGFKGYVSGGAAVSTRHCNFIVNRGSARATDVLGLIDEIKTRVLSSAGILLEEEIQIVGRD